MADDRSNVTPLRPPVAEPAKVTEPPFPHPDHPILRVIVGQAVNAYQSGDLTLEGAVTMHGVWGGMSERGRRLIRRGRRRAASRPEPKPRRRVEPVPPEPPPSFDPDDWRRFVAQVRAARQARRLHQIDLAARVGVAQTTISAIERGERPSAALLERLVSVLGVRPPARADDEAAA